MDIWVAVLILKVYKESDWESNQQTVKTGSTIVDS